MPVKLFGKKYITLYCDGYLCMQSQKFVYVRTSGNVEIYACTRCGVTKEYTVR